MEHSPTENVPEVLTNGTSQVVTVTDCLDTPVILRITLEHFSDDELLKLSLVNKRWNYEARSVLKDRGSLMAIIRSRQPCQELKRFASDLRTMIVVPFSGIGIVLRPWSHNTTTRCLGPMAGGLGPIYQEILHRLQWKCLHVIFNQIGEESKNCPAFQLVQKIICDFGGALQDLTLVMEYNREHFIQQVLQHCSFSRLKILELQDRYNTTGAVYTSLIKALVSRSPQLEELHIEGPVDLKQNLLEGSSARLVTNFVVSPTLDDIPHGVLGALCVKQLKLIKIRPGLSLQQNTITPSLLQQSQLTLSSMELDVAFLVPLMCYKICLANVQEFQMRYNCLVPFQPRILDVIKTFDFTKIFPLLVRVQSFGNWDPNTELQSQMIEFMDQWNPTFDEPSVDRAANIKGLRMSFCPSLGSHCPAGFLPEMLPHIEKLSVESFRGEILPSVIFEQHWADLKDLTVHKVQSDTSKDETLDSAFCGIFPEEAAELWAKDDDYLKAVHIVPVMPSIVCLKGLRTFTFNGGRDCYFPDGVHDPEFMFSEVSGLVAFKRCTALSITLQTDDKETFEALDLMKPYASVVLGSPSIGLSRCHC